MTLAQILAYFKNNLGHFFSNYANLENVSNHVLQMNSYRDN